MQAIETTKDNSQKLYQCYFTGRKVKAIGENYSIRSVVLAGSKEAARQKLYNHYENITACEIEEAQPKATEVALKMVAVFHLYNNCLPVISDYENTEAKGNLRIGLWREGSISTIWADLNDRLSIQLGRNGTRDSFSITFSGSYYSKQHGCLSAGDSISINVSIDKSAEQIVKDIKNRIFKAHAEQVEAIEKKVRELKAKEELTENNRKELAKEFTFHSSNDKSCYAGDCTLNLEIGYITVALRQQYYSVTTAKQAMQVAKTLNDALAKVEEIVKE